ncbi:tRNA (adenosine(37)-N6)-dimethylallyltransferase MiaA [soil metagenome]
MQKPTLVIVLGPTGVGKTAVAISLAKKFKTSVISADSRQFYKEIPIGTAQPSSEELNSVPHFFIGNYSVTETVDAGKYSRDVHELLNEKFNENDVLIMAGGSGLYIDAVVNGFDELPDANAELRAELQRRFEEEGIENLQQELEKLDTDFYAEIDRNNPARLIRAIEVCRLTGKKYSELRAGKKVDLPFRVIKVGLDLPREELYERINFRVDEMIKNGLEEEVKSVLNFRNLNALQTVGYKELFAFFDGEISKEKAVELIKQHSRNYAKRQLTWWRKDQEIKWFSPKEVASIENFIAKELANYTHGK